MAGLQVLRAKAPPSPPSSEPGPSGRLACRVPGPAGWQSSALSAEARINEQLKHARRWEDIAAVLEPNVALLDTVNVSTAWTALAKLYGRGTAEGPGGRRTGQPPLGDPSFRSFMAFLLSATVAAVPRCRTQALSNIVWALSHVDWRLQDHEPRTQELMHAWCRAVHSRLRDLQPADVSNISAAIGRLDSHWRPQFLASFYSYILRRPELVEALDVTTLNNLLFGISRARRRGLLRVADSARTLLEATVARQLLGRWVVPAPPAAELGPEGYQHEDAELPARHVAPHASAASASSPQCRGASEPSARAGASSGAVASQRSAPKPWLAGPESGEAGGEAALLDIGSWLSWMDAQPSPPAPAQPQHAHHAQQQQQQQQRAAAAALAHGPNGTAALRAPPRVHAAAPPLEWSLAPTPRGVVSPWRAAQLLVNADLLRLQLPGEARALLLALSAQLYCSGPDAAAAVFDRWSLDYTLALLFAHARVCALARPNPAALAEYVQRQRLGEASTKQLSLLARLLAELGHPLELEGPFWAHTFGRYLRLSAQQEQGEQGSSLQQRPQQLVEGRRAGSGAAAAEPAGTGPPASGAQQHPQQQALGDVSGLTEAVGRWRAQVRAWRASLARSSRPRPAAAGFSHPGSAAAFASAVAAGAAAAAPAAWADAVDVALGAESSLEEGSEQRPLMWVDRPHGQGAAGDVALLPRPQPRPLSAPAPAAELPGAGGAASELPAGQAAEPGDVGAAAPGRGLQWAQPQAAAAPPSGGGSDEERPWEPRRPAELNGAAAYGSPLFGSCSGRPDSLAAGPDQAALLAAPAALGVRHVGAGHAAAASSGREGLGAGAWAHGGWAGHASDERPSESEGEAPAGWGGEEEELAAALLQLPDPHDPRCRDLVAPRSLHYVCWQVRMMKCE
jgi:hypothetical protein